jgi:hypothetical protein
MVNIARGCSQPTEALAQTRRRIVQRFGDWSSECRGAGLRHVVDRLPKQ